MSEEHDPIDIEKYMLKPGRWRIRYYKDNADPAFRDVSNPDWMEKIYVLKMPTFLKELMIEDYKMGSCWQMP